MSLFFLLLLSFRLVTGTWKKEVMTPRQHPAPCKEERFWGQMIHGARYVGTWPINIDGWFIGSSCLLPCRFTSAWRDDWPANGPLSLSLSSSWWADPAYSRAVTAHALPNLEELLLLAQISIFGVKKHSNIITFPFRWRYYAAACRQNFHSGW